MITASKIIKAKQERIVELENQLYEAVALLKEARILVKKGATDNEKTWFLKLSHEFIEHTKPKP